ncbi:MAG TPA: type II toxin-antitoxin system prevent-host-death family antitoxin [Azospirillaceae bacterium]|nr:type II toxin-antitoxin system prevent-host-death family antitoxin [Azospirillaceae bacterium]
MSEQTVTAAEANQHFAEILDKAAQGESFVITRGDRPVARIVPVAAAAADDADEEARRRDAHARLMEMIRTAGDHGGERFDRDSVYADRIDRY